MSKELEPLGSSIHHSSFIIHHSSLLFLTTETHGNTRKEAVRSFLPRDVPDFTGRADELQALLSFGRGPRGDGVPVCAIEGMAGIGKTALMRQVLLRFAEAPAALPLILIV